MRNGLIHKWFNSPILWVGKDKSPPAGWRGGSERRELGDDSLSSEVTISYYFKHRRSSPIAPFLRRDPFGRRVTLQTKPIY